MQSSTKINPGEDSRGHVRCGHIHHRYRLIAGQNDTVRAPVFWFEKQCSVLPSFGQYTGGHAVTPTKADHQYMAENNNAPIIEQTKRYDHEHKC